MKSRSFALWVCTHIFREKRNPSASALANALQCKKVTRALFEEKGVKDKAESVAEVKDVNDTTPAASGARQPEAESAF